jgi:hypothetical protein
MELSLAIWITGEECKVDLDGSSYVQNCARFPNTQGYWVHIEAHIRSEAFELEISDRNRARSSAHGDKLMWSDCVSRPIHASPIFWRYLIRGPHDPDPGNTYDGSAGLSWLDYYWPSYDT